MLQKVLVIGSGYSGLDIASQVEPLCTPPLLHSTRSKPSTLSTNPNNTPPTPDTQTRSTIPSIKTFLPTTEAHGKRALEFENGRIEKDIDALIFATGYLYSYPFLSQTPNPSSSSTPTTTTGHRTPQTYHHLFSPYTPTLTHLLLPQKIVPFPTAQAQAAVLARIYSGRLTLPCASEMSAWESQRIAEKGEGKRFHYLDGGEDVVYLRMLEQWADCARDGGDGVGKAPPRWGEKERWMRERVGEIKKAWVGFGEGRKEVTTLEACGFDFEVWKKEEKERNGVDGDHGRGEKTDDVEDAANGGQAEG